MVGISEVVACLIASPVKNNINRIKSLSGSALLASVGCILTIILTIPEECYLPGESCIKKGLNVIFN